MNKAPVPLSRDDSMGHSVELDLQGKMEGKHGTDHLQPVGSTWSSQCYQEQYNPVSRTGSSAVLCRKLTVDSSSGGAEETGEVCTQYLPLELDVLRGDCG